MATYQCSNCGWEGDEEDLKILMVEGIGKTLNETPGCPDCMKDDIEKISD